MGIAAAARWGVAGWGAAVMGDNVQARGGTGFAIRSAAMPRIGRERRVRPRPRAQRDLLLHRATALGANVQGVPGQAPMSLAIAFGGRRLGRGRREQGAAPRELGGAMAVGQKPNVADAMEVVAA
jgi:hypothetical protein